MFNKIKKFFADKEKVKTAALWVTVPTAIIGVVALFGVNRLNKIIDKNGLNDLFYPWEE